MSSPVKSEMDKLIKLSTKSNCTSSNSFFTICYLFFSIHFVFALTVYVLIIRKPLSESQSVQFSRTANLKRDALVLSKRCCKKQEMRIMKLRKYDLNTRAISAQRNERYFSLNIKTFAIPPTYCNFHGKCFTPFWFYREFLSHFFVVFFCS